MGDGRLNGLAQWCKVQLENLQGQELQQVNLQVVSGDASFRHYFRAVGPGWQYIAVDAPPENEDNEAFIRVAEIFSRAGVNMPRIWAADIAQGYMLLDDFGDELYLPQLLHCQQNNDFVTADNLYHEAIDALLDIQMGVESKQLDPFDRNELHREMELFSEWFCKKLLGVDPPQELLQEVFRFLEDAALSQPTVAVHRDYHSRNLMLLDSNRFTDGPGIIDFQDAVSGPYTYDLVSLLRDCYIRWDDDQVARWANYYLSAAQSRGLVQPADANEFVRDFDLMGLQRHLKVMGIFARLAIRDKKPRYLADIPLVIRYFFDVGQRYPELTALLEWFEQSLLPVARTKLSLED